MIMAISIQQLFADFLASPDSDISGTDYNECTLVCRFAAYLRMRLPGYHVECGRNIEYFGLNKKIFYKRDIDIVIYKRDEEGKITEKYAIEMKCPTASGKETTQKMTDMLLDVAFTRQLTSIGGFDGAYSIALTKDQKFYRPAAVGGRRISGKYQQLYDIFRDGKSVGNFTVSKGKTLIKIDQPVQVTWIPVNSSDYCYYIV